MCVRSEEERGRVRYEGRGDEKKEEESVLIERN